MKYPTLREQKANKCKHFNGLSNMTCRAGVQYEDVKGPAVNGKGYSLPCFKDDGDGCQCDKREFRTEAELDAADAEHKGSMERMMAARKAIVEHLGGPWKKGTPGAGGVIGCPTCKGKLQFSRAGYNGHIHARCSTDGCCSWME